MSLINNHSRTAGWMAAGALAVLAGGIAIAQHGGPLRIGQVWGSFAWQTAITPSATLPALVTFHVDGTVTGVDGTMFGGTPAATTRTTPFHGVWDRTGFRSIAGTSLWMIFDATGTRIAWGRSRSTLDFASNFDTLEGKIFVETLACPTPVTCPDPLNSAARWTAMPGMPATGFSAKATRIEVVKAGPLP